MTPIAEVRLPIHLDRERAMVFDLHTMAAYEEATAKFTADGQPKFFWDMMLKLLEFYEEHAQELQAVGKPSESDTADIIRRRTKLGMQIMRYISARDLHALLWASLHTYNGDTPVWDITIEKVGRLLRPQQTLPVVFQIVNGYFANSPTKAELGEASGPVLVAKPAEQAPMDDADGGEVSIAVPADAFAS